MKQTEPIQLRTADAIPVRLMADCPSRIYSPQETPRKEQGSESSIGTLNGDTYCQLLGTNCRCKDYRNCEDYWLSQARENQRTEEHTIRFVRRGQ